MRDLESGVLVFSDGAWKGRFDLPRVGWHHSSFATAHAKDSFCASAMTSKQGIKLNVWFSVVWKVQDNSIPICLLLMASDLALIFLPRRSRRSLASGSCVFPFVSSETMEN